ncbi:MAG: ECF transporter S component [Oscillospiraceae bacterium]|nr:ECF transporter S component [Oscillospiraceae bacterium]
MNTKTRQLVTAALMAALVCIATMIVKIPTPLKGYVNLGDGIVLTAGWMLSPAYGFFAAALGSALADIFSGYVLYAPATFLIKGLMALIAYLVCAKMGKRFLGGLAAEIAMILGYFIYESFLYGPVPSALNIPANGLQGIFGLIVSLLLIKVIEKNKLAQR